MRAAWQRLAAVDTALSCASWSLSDEGLQGTAPKVGTSGPRCVMLGYWAHGLMHAEC